MKYTRIALLLSAAGLGAPGLAYAAGGLIHDGIPAWSPEGSNISVDIRGRLQFDIADIDHDFAVPQADVNDSEFRAARLGADIDAGALSISAEFDFAGNEFQPADVTAGWQVNDVLSVTVGHFKEAFSLEELTSGRFTSFMERGSFTDAFDLARRAGIKVDLGGDRWNVTLAAQDGTMDGLDIEAATGSSLSARAVFSPVMDEDNARYVHLGAAVRVRDLDAGDPLFRYRQRPLAHLSVRTVDTGGVAGKDTTYGLEAATGFGAFHAEAEYAWLDAERPGALADAAFNGFYVSAGWFITGEHRTYTGARFDRIRPARALGQGGLGALELVARYDEIDLSDGAIAGGQQSNRALGANWYPTARTRLTLNYVDSDVDGGPLGGGDSQIVQTRLQFDW